MLLINPLSARRILLFILLVGISPNACSSARFSPRSAAELKRAVANCAGQLLKCDHSIARWDVSNVRRMSGMFQGAASFNGDLSKWQVSNVINMKNMFRDAASFNRNLCGARWVHSKALKTDMFVGSSGLISRDVCTTIPPASRELCTATAPDIEIQDGDRPPPDILPRIRSNEDLKREVATFLRLTPKATGLIGDWDVSRVTDMSNLFHGAEWFNGDISKWDVSRVTDMSGMFQGAPSFNGDISKWDVSSVMDMSGMFQGATSFDGDLSKWDVSRVTDMTDMFLDARTFNDKESNSAQLLYAKKANKVAAVSGVNPSSVNSFMAKLFLSKFSGLECHEVSGRHAITSRQVQKDKIRPGGYISGPTQFATVDRTMRMAVLGAKGFDETFTTNELSIRYLRPATGKTLWCRVDVNSVGTRAVVMTATTWTTDPDKPTAIAQGTFTLSKKQDKDHIPPDYVSTMSPKEEVHPSPTGVHSTVAAPPGVNPTSVNEYGSKHWPTLHSVFPGFKCEEVSGSHAVTSRQIPEDEIRPGGFISVATQFAMVDFTMNTAVFGAKGFMVMALTSDMSIRYLRPATGKTLWCRVDVNSVGTRAVVMTATTWTTDPDKPLAITQGTFMLPN